MAARDELGRWSPIPRLLVFLALSVVLAPGLRAQTFTKVVGSGDAIPGGTFSFLGFNEAPGLDGDHVAYIGTYQDLSGTVSAIFSNASGSFVRVAKTGDTMPGTSVPLEFLLRLAIDRTSIAFEGSSFVGSISRTAIITDASGSLLDVVDKNTFVPGFGSFSQLGGQDMSLDEGVVVFTGTSPSNVRGLFSVGATSQNVFKVADSNQIAPGSGGGNYFSFGAPAIRDGRLAFHSSVSGQMAVFEQVGPGTGAVTRLIGGGDLAPNGQPYTFVFGPVVDEDDTMFYGAAGGISGVHRIINGQLAVGADAQTPVPGGPGVLTDFDDYAISNDRIAFEAVDFNGGGWIGIFTDVCGALSAVVRPGDIVDGKLVLLARMDEDSLDGDRLALNIQFSDGSSGIYIADLTAIGNSGVAYAGSDPAAPTVEGIGCPGIGTNVTLHFRGAPVAPTAGYLIVGLATVAAPIPTGGTLLVQADWVIPVLSNVPNYGHTTGWLDVSNNIPNNPALSGTTLHVQALWADPGVTNGWLATDRLTIPIP